MVILAGGRGRRLGRDKATLEIGGETLIERAVRRMSSLADDIVVVARPGQRWSSWLDAAEARSVPDLWPYSGVLAGIAAGLLAARRNWCFVMACDMPFVNPDLVRQMLSASLESDAVVPRLDVGVEPLHALYHRRCLPALLDALAQGRRRIISFHGPLRIHYHDTAAFAQIDPEHRSFFNINTPEDVIHAQELVCGERPVHTPVPPVEDSLP